MNSELVNVGREKFFYLITAVFLTIVILIVLKPVFWRPFNTSSESQDSIVFLKFVIANNAGLWPNPLVAREPVLKDSTIRPYNHWTNGYYLLNNIILKIFKAENTGNREIILRTIAVITTLLSVFLIILAIAPDNPFLYFSVPLILLTNIGRDALSFPWKDLPLAAIGLYLIVNRRRNKFFKYLFWSSLIILPLFLQTTIVYLFSFIIVDFLIYRDKKDFLINLIWLALSTLLFLGILFFGFGSDFRESWSSLSGIIVARGAWTPLSHADPNVSFTLFARYLLRRVYESLNMGLVGVVLVALSWFVAFKKKRYWLAALVPCWLIYAIVFRGGVFANYYSYFPYVLFILITFIYGLNYLKEFLYTRLAFSDPTKKLLEITAILFLGLNFYLFPTIYPITDKIKNSIIAPPPYDLDAMVSIRKDLDIISTGVVKEQIDKLGCNAFIIESYDEMSGWVRVGAQTFLGDYIIGRVNDGTSLKKCSIDIGNKKVLEITI